jgi:hypothetical protein
MSKYIDEIPEIAQEELIEMINDTGIKFEYSSFLEKTILGSKALGLSSTCKNCYENSSTFRNNL